MKKAEALNLIEHLKNIFEIVRLVDVPKGNCYVSDGKQLVGPTQCYSVWGKECRCENCISAEVFSSHKKMSKFEFAGDDTYYVLSQYIEIDGTPYALELVNKVEDKSLFGAYGKQEFAKTIQHYTSKMFQDPLTGAYNRLYYSEQYDFIINNFSIAMLDIDNFKLINDEYGHLVGDLALIKIVKTFKRLIQGSEAIIRYGGDEFLIVLNRATPDELYKRLETMRYEISKISFDDYPKLKLTVSIGGISTKCCDSIQKVDDLMYRAKIKRNTVVVE